MLVSTVSYSISFNMLGPITPKCGLRQGDPLSPYLFLLCVEGMSRALSLAAARGEITGSQVCTNVPKITHMLFAYDSFLFFKVNNQEAIAIKSLLQRYESLSG